MNGPAKLERMARSSKETAMSKARARNPLKELNAADGLAARPPPSLGSSEVSRRGCFSFLLSNSSSRETPASAPPVRRAAALESRRAKPSRYVNSQNAAPRCDLGASKKAGMRKDPRLKAPELKPRRNRGNPGLKREKVEEKCSIDDSLGGQSEFCLVSSPKKGVTLGFSGNAALPEAVEGEEKIATTPDSAITPPIEASISPEVPIGASAVAATPVCFAAGHVLVGVHDRRKCRPRGVLTIGGFAPEMAGDPSRLSSTTPPIAEASIQWLSPSFESVNSGTQSSLSSTSRVRHAHCAAEALMSESVFPTGDGDDVCQDEMFADEYFGGRFESSDDNGLARYSPPASGAAESPKLHGRLSDLSLPYLETTLSSGGLNVQKTPTTGGSVSPFSMILESFAKTARSKLIKPQHEQGGKYGDSFTLETSPFSSESWINDNVICTPSMDPFSRKQQLLSPIEMDELQGSLGNISLSLDQAMHDKYSKKPDQSFHFECTPISLNSVNLNHFQRPSSEELCDEQQSEASSETRMSWREGLVSRTFDMSELECSHWLSDEEDSFTYDEFFGLESVSDTKFDQKNKSSISDYKNDRFMSDDLGSIEFARGDSVDKCEEKVPAPGSNSCAESISTDGLQSISSDDSNWTLFYKNHLFEK